MAITASVTPGRVFQENDAITVSSLNQLGSPTVDIQGAIGSLGINSNSIVNTHVQAGAGIQWSKMESTTGGNIIVGNSSNTPTAVTLSGDATLSNTGSLTISDNAIETAMIADSTGASDGITTAKLADNSVTLAKLEDGTEGDVLYYGGSGAPARLAKGTASQYLRMNSGATAPEWSAGDGHGIQIISASSGSSNSGNFTVPDGVSKISIKMWGGGGAGEATSSGSNQGGGSGAFVWKTNITVVAGTDYAYVVGRGGIHSATGSDRHGVDTTFTVGDDTWSAGGGSTGSAGVWRPYNGYGGTANGTNWPAQDPGNSHTGRDTSGYATGDIALNGLQATTGGGANAPFGGGKGTAPRGSEGTGYEELYGKGGFPGGGGGGGDGTTSGEGGDGLLIIEW
tara:strand:+ start:3182 stop:4372 length:1191 start_codon:yes stop_codon:yes gene_type:complete